MPVVFRPTLDPNKLAPFVDPLPIPPVAKPIGTRAVPGNRSREVPYYRITMRQIDVQLHRDLKPTPCWSYGSSVPGPTFETRSGEGLTVEWANELPSEHFLPIDHTLAGAESNLPQVRTVVHVHGAITPPESDGYPENWYPPGRSLVCHYPNEQEAAMLWYHDHAMGINRLNIYAGLAGTFFVRDATEDKLNLPKGKYELPLILFDRFLTPDGELYYPTSNARQRPWVPEVFGNAFLVNGKLLPYFDVEPRRYRFRVLNAANGRFYHLSLDNGMLFTQIGTDQGLLGAPSPAKRLTLAPGERADLVIDFAGHSGERIVVNNDVLPMMQFRVGKGKVEDNSAVPAVLRPIKGIPESAATKNRELTLDEVDDLTGQSYTMLLNNTHWAMPVTEKPALNSVEIWSFVNLTDDVHPIHLHTVRFQILDRRSFNLAQYLVHRKLVLTGDPMPPGPEERGWKDTVRATPGVVTRIIVRFEGYTGRYVWHCHILEHEDNEMMRPYEIVPRG
ncbi:MAG TPA: multicopper oxidase domain-containing protein [Bryobacteraceae bacterium]|nr:multicopper oxidase domain-containing protein [Bryobacteraceae bacterium]